MPIVVNGHPVAVSTDLVELTPAQQALVAQLSTTIGDLTSDPSTPTGRPDMPGLFYGSVLFRVFGDAQATTLINRVLTRGLTRGRFKQAMTGFNLATTAQQMLAKINAA